ncbi:MAG TPA: hypothetical protein VLA72_00985 [Anaerolineales bacterium]|nr:hypothetical protein [Anaerolineales bacterium]
MITKEKSFNTPLLRYRLGVALVWLGVFAWAPYIFLRVTGQDTSPLWFLPIHLIGVVGGSRLRSYARKEMGISKTRKNLIRVTGHVMIWAGVSVWVPYFYMKLVMQESVSVMNYLPYHLTGVLGGLLMLGIGLWIDRRANR